MAEGCRGTGQTMMAASLAAILMTSRYERLCLIVLQAPCDMWQLIWSLQIGTTLLQWLVLVDDQRSCSKHRNESGVWFLLVNQLVFTRALMHQRQVCRAYWCLPCALMHQRQVCRAYWCLPCAVMLQANSQLRLSGGRLMIAATQAFVELTVSIGVC